MADPNQLTGRALDVAVAKVLWHGGDLDHPEHPSRDRHYSTDAACISEMLAWLESQGEDVELLMHFLAGGWHCDFAPRISAVAAACSNATGATLQEALARLVVAVWEAQDVHDDTAPLRAVILPTPRPPSTPRCARTGGRCAPARACAGRRQGTRPATSSASSWGR